jgi:hypothetical protein
MTLDSPAACHGSRVSLRVRPSKAVRPGFVAVCLSGLSWCSALTPGVTRERDLIPTVRSAYGRPWPLADGGRVTASLTVGKTLPAASAAGLAGYESV